MNKEILIEAGKLMGASLERKRDNKSLAVMDYFGKRFVELRNGEITLQELFDECRIVWDETPIKT